MTTPTTTASGLSFGGLTPASTPPTGLAFGVPSSTGATGTPPSLGTGLSSSVGGGLTFGGGLTGFGDASKSPMSSGLTFGAAKSTAPTSGTTSGFTLGSTGFGSPAVSGSPSFGASNISTSFGAATTPTPGFNLTAAATSTGASSGFSLTPTTGTGGVSFGATSTAPSTGFTLGQSAATTSASTGFSLSAPATAAVTGFSIPAATSVSSLATSTASMPAAGFSLPTASTAVVAPTSSTTPSFSLGSTAPTSVAVTSSAQSTTQPKGSVSFSQLEETINKWTLELEEQERVFLNQMEQVRDWDKLLLSTGDKIVCLNDGMQKVKLRQHQLDHELDFIVAQQRELEECLVPLEKEFADISISDPERDSVYQRAENLNTQLQQVAEQLKTVIEHVNERNRSQDTTDPIVQIGKILNAHMNSLQWVDQNTAVIQQMLDQIGKMREIHLRDVDSTQNI